jgi:DNA repair protein RadC
MYYVRDSEGTYTFTQAVTAGQLLELASELIDERYPKGVKLDCPAASREYLRHKLAHLPDEHFWVIYLTAQHELIASVDTFRGSLTSVEVHCRVIVREALLNNAAAVLLAHNHPSFQPTPSHADRALTSRLIEALQLIGVRVLDHIIVGGRDCASMAELGMLG